MVSNQPLELEEELCCLASLVVKKQLGPVAM